MKNHNMPKPLEIYVHIPFCAKKCAYCDFLSAPAGRKQQEEYGQAVRKEIRGLSDTEDFEVVSVFFGGGTPSLPEASLLTDILDELKIKLKFSPEAEITIEANPGTLTKEKLSAYRNAGINRLSLGLQSADNRELQILGRIHTFEEFLESWRLALEAGFDNINVDLMFALPDQTEAGWEQTLRRTAKLGPAHISAYSLIVEEGTPFAERELNLPDEDTEYRMYDRTAEVLAEYGYEQYEISNYARPGAACRHNLGYWDRTEYLGIGLGAASLFGGQRFSNTAVMAEYLADSGDPNKTRRNLQTLTLQEEMEEFMFLGLRKTAGVSEAIFEEKFGKNMNEKYGSVIEKYVRTGFLERRDGHVRLTGRGIHVSNTIMADFLEG